MPDVHHVFSPSSADRHMECVGYLIGPEITREAGDAAKEGTLCHKLLEYSQMGMEPDWFAGQCLLEGPEAFRDNGQPLLVDAEMIAAVRMFNQIASELLEELGIDRANTWPERHLAHPAIPEELFGGTSDFSGLSVENGVLLIMDLKYGRNPVKARSYQLFEYAMLALSTLTPEQQQQIRRLVFVVVQPRVNFGEQWDRYEPSIEEMNEAWTRLNKQIDLYLAHRHMPHSPPELLSTGKHCSYCPRQMHCPAITRDMTEIVVLANIPLNTEDDGLVHTLLYWSEKAEAIKGFLRRIDLALHELASRGVTVPGKKLVPAFGNRTWKPELMAEGDSHILRRLIRKFGKVANIKAVDCREVKVLSPTKIEALLKEKGVWRGNKKLQESFHDLVHKPVKGAKLVDMSDPGEQVTPQLAQELKQAFLEMDSE